MAVTREKQSLDLVLVHEGGYSNHPADPGSPTMKGVTQRVYDGYRKRKGPCASGIARCRQRWRSRVRPSNRKSNGSSAPLSNRRNWLQCRPL
ncbi:glycosyl hydrolase 108 family protein [Mesorhizobium sp. M0676]|uniref:glycosyl hydrolase 108 family protein n=1 Tax=Mesorhizobium sp. M0676 TaxID=2956984 RepID=UPI0033379A2A